VNSRMRKGNKDDHSPSGDAFGGGACTRMRLKVVESSAQN
jgi:hypothetical protein